MLQSMGSQRLGHDLVTEQQNHSTIPPIFDIVIVLDFSHLNRSAVLFYCCLIGNFLMVYDVELLFLCLVTIYIQA